MQTEIKAILHLNLIRKWYDMIASNQKKEEYRDVKPYWQRIFTKKGIKVKGKYYRPENVAVLFSNGYAKNREQMMLNIDCVAIREGLEKWGAEPGKQYFVITFKGDTRNDELKID